MTQLLFDGSFNDEGLNTKRNLDLVAKALEAVEKRLRKCRVAVLETTQAFAHMKKQLHQMDTKRWSREIDDLTRKAQAVTSIMTSMQPIQLEQDATSMPLSNAVPAQTTKADSGSWNMQGESDLQGRIEMMEQIRNKAVEIYDQLLMWSSALNQGLDVRVFETFASGWQTSSVAINTAVIEAASNLSTSFGTACTVSEGAWSMLMQNGNASLLSLGGMAEATGQRIANALMTASIQGVQYMKSGTDQIAAVVQNLASNVNRSFVTPLIGWLNGQILPSILAVSLAIHGQVTIVMASLNAITDWFPRCQAWIGSLSTSFSGMFASLKTMKADAFFSEHETNVTKTLLDTVFDLGETVMSTATSMADFGEVCTGVATKASETMLNFGGSIEGVAGTILTGLGSALSWLAANPMVLLFGALAAGVAALFLFEDAQEDTAFKIENCSEAVQEQAKKIEELGAAMDQANETYEESLISAEANALGVEKALSDLQALGGKTGFIDNDNLARANVLVEKINASLGTQIEISDQGKLILHATNEELKDSVQNMREKAKEEAKYQLYVEYQKEYLIAQKEENENRQKAAELEKKKNELVAKRKNLEKANAGSGVGSPGYTEYREKIIETNAQIGELEKNIMGYNTVADQAKQKTNECSDSMKALDGETDETSAGVKVLSDDMARYYAGFALSDEKASEFEAMANQIITNSEKMKTANGEELLTMQHNKDASLTAYAEKALGMDMSYSEMISMLEGRGIELTETEKAWLENSYQAMKDGATREEAEFMMSKNRILEDLKLHHANMTQEELSHYGAMLDFLNQHGINVSELSTGQYKAMMAVLGANNVSITDAEDQKYALLLGMLNQYGIAADSAKSDQYARMIALANQHNIDLSSVQGQQYAEFLSEL